jgi:hypothetical protein
MPRQPINLNDVAMFREELNQGIKSALSSGEVAGEAKIGASSLLSVVIANATAGRPIFAGASIWRGSKDPDVERGSFDPQWKHGSPSLDIAAGYARDANSGIGFNPQSTAGFGVIARYDIDQAMRFYRNFGIEDQTDGKSLSEIESDLQPLVSAYLEATKKPGYAAIEESAEERAIAQYLHAHMYEASIPSDMKASQKWLSFPTAEAVYATLEINDASLSHLEDVLVSLVEARRLEIDANATRKAIQGLKQGLASSLPADHALTQDAKDALSACENLLARTLRSSTNAPAGLDEAIAMRRAHQAQMNLTRLTNSAGHTTSTGSSADRAVVAVAELYRDAQSSSIHTRDEQRLSKLNDVLTALHRTAAGLVTQSKRLMENTAATTSNLDGLKENARRVDALIEKQAAVRARVADARSSLPKRAYYATLGRSQMATWTASARAIAKAIQQQNKKGYALEGKAKHLQDARTEIEAVRAHIGSDHADNFKAALEIAEEGELQGLSLGSPKAKLADLVASTINRLEQAKTHSSHSAESAQLLRLTAQLIRAGMPIEAAYNSAVAVAPSIGAAPDNESDANARSSPRPMSMG